MARRLTAVELVARVNPLPADDRVDALVPNEWREELLGRVLSEPVPTPRSERMRPVPQRLLARRWLVLAVLVALGVLIATPALGLHRHIVHFLEAEPAPERVQVEFAQLEAGAPLGLGPGVLPGQARKVLDASLGGERRSLWVAPTKDGGFCWTWPDILARCSRRDAALAVVRVDRINEPGLLGGDVLDRATAELELRYEDGNTADIPFAWISQPIDAGLFVFEVPREHLDRGHRAETLIARSADGDELTRYTFRYSDPALERAADGLPAAADRSRKRTLIDTVGPSGRRWTLTVAPAPADRLCYTYQTGSGCVSGATPGQELAVGLQNTGGAVILFGTVGSGIASIELQFQDGTRTRLEPVDGFVLAEVPAAHYQPGHRLTSIIGFTTEGREIARQDVQQAGSGIYPCVEPADVGNDVRICK